MATLWMALGLAALNLLLIWLLLAAPIGLRTITIQRSMPADPRMLWQLIGPGAALDLWKPGLAGCRWTEGDGSRLDLAYSQRDQHGEPVTRSLAVSASRAGGFVETRVAEDSVFDPAIWRDFSEKWELSADASGSLVTFSQTDTYRGLAMFIWRYVSLRAEIGALADHVAGRPARRKAGGTGYTLLQAVLALVSTLAFWPLFGLTPIGLMISTFLTLVIVLHELGHMAAYRAFGHEQVRMIFIPLLGGVAIGGRPYRSRFEMATCALMGAGLSAFVVPILIAVDSGARQALPDHWVSVPSLAFLLILGAFNLLNLLPTHGFDGGQVLRQVFRGEAVLGVATFLVAGLVLWTGYRVGISPPGLVGALAVFALLSLIRTGGPKPRHALPDMNAPERLFTGFGYFAALSLHAVAVTYACDRLFG